MARHECRFFRPAPAPEFGANKGSDSLDWGWGDAYDYLISAGHANAAELPLGAIPLLIKAAARRDRRLRRERLMDANMATAPAKELNRYLQSLKD